MSTKRSPRVVLTLALSLLAILPSTRTQAADPHNSKGFRKAVTVAGITEHLSAFQAISDANGGNRAAGRAGFNESVEYVVDRLTAAGYSPEIQEFPLAFFEELEPSLVQQVAPNAKTYASSTLGFSGNGDVTATIQAVDVTIPPPPIPGVTSGCEAADFAGFVPGNIALIQRGSCTFAIKVTNAHNAGASGVIVFNEGQPGRTGVVAGTLAVPGFSIPVAGVSYATGEELVALSQGGPVTGRVKTNGIGEYRPTYNVIAETATGNPNHVVVIGAHLDSVEAGPGINDNGSGAATILEVAEVYAEQGREPRNQLRFIWFGAEELGLLGSAYYVSQLSAAEIEKIELNLNFDMIGSPNYVRFVYDGNNSAFPVGPGSAAGPAGSGAIEEVFHSYFASQGLPSAETPFSGRSDYGPFIARGIPAGGLFTGAEGKKTAAQAEIYGGTANVAFDVCYHQACDTLTNINTQGLDEMSDAVAHAVLYFSKWNFDKTPLVDGPPTHGQGNGGEGGGLHNHDDHQLPTE